MTDFIFMLCIGGDESLLLLVVVAVQTTDRNDWSLQSAVLYLLL